MNKAEDLLLAMLVDPERMRQLEQRAQQYAQQTLDAHRAHGSDIGREQLASSFVMGYSAALVDVCKGRHG